MASMNDIVAAKYIPAADAFLKSVEHELVTEGTAGQSNIDKINASLAQHRLPITAAGFRAAYEAVKDKLELKPPPVPPEAPKKYRGSPLEILEQSGYKPCLRESPDELAAAEFERAKNKSALLKDLRDSAQRQKDNEQRFAEEHEVVYLPNGRINHAASDRKQKAARERWAQRDKALKS